MENKMAKLFTIGFTKKTAEVFFSRLKDAGVKKLIDVRLWNTSVYAGFTNARDFPYFLKLHNTEYRHLPEFAPTKEILKAYKDGKMSWEEYEKQYLELLENRKIAERLKNANLDGACLLCAEPTPEHCHRRLLAEYLRDNFEGIEIVHL
jgi:uncharacterized protein (DUF488 family)